MLKEPICNSTHQTAQAGNRHYQGAVVLCALAGLFGFQKDDRRASGDRLVHVKISGRFGTRKGYKRIAGGDFPAVGFQTVNGHVEDRWNRHNTLQ